MREIYRVVSPAVLRPWDSIATQLKDAHPYLTPVSKTLSKTGLGEGLPGFENKKYRMPNHI